MSILSSNQPNCKEKKCFRIAEQSYKGRLYNHNLSVRNEFYKNDTEICKELWKIMVKNYTPEKTWRIIRKCLLYNYNSRKCYLCLNEKLEIALYEGENLLNKKRNSFANAVIKTSSCYYVMIPRTENYVCCKEAIILR